jgi:pimeloyl-ACP methyl ester carboxylesterase
LTRRRHGRPLRPDEYVNWQVWGQKDSAGGALWRTFLAEQRALLRELNELERALPSVGAPVLVLADPRDGLVPVDTARRLAQYLPDAHLQLIHGAGHHLPRRAPAAVAEAIVDFLTATDSRPPAAGRSAPQAQPAQPVLA